MAFMTVLLVFLAAFSVWAYFHTDPPGVPLRSRLLYNGAVLAVAAAAAIAVGATLYADAIVVKAGQAGLPTYLSVMAGCTVFLIALALGGVMRNFFVFPEGKRAVVSPRKPAG
ncbi:hypothetical protein BURK1_01146 [Burkholderiales bacterium]|nr:hypothetical protein BURK1_01146 [Burkholderiales bacterium]